MKYSLFLFMIICQVSSGQDTSKIKELFKQAMEYEDKGDIGNALKTQIKLFNLDTKNYASANIIAGLYGKAGRFTEEIQWADKAIQIHPGFSNAYINLGNGYAGLQDFTNAEINYKEALNADSLSP